MKKLLMLLLILASVNSFSQAKIETDTLIYDIKGLQVKPEYPGGLKKMYDFIDRKFKFPREILSNPNARKVYVSFIIEKDGTLSNMKVIRDVGYDTDKEAIRVLKLMPKWLPGQQNGIAVRTLFTLAMPLNGY